MNSCCQCQGVEQMFDARFVRRELAQYRAKGPDKTTRMLVDFIKAQGVDGATLLDIGGGLGAIQHQLLEAGAERATSVEASSAYVQVAREEAQRRGYAERVTYHQGNFVDLADQIDPADIVTLDRVICCYHDMDSLVRLSSARARRLYGLVFPRDTWWLKLGLALGNGIYHLERSFYRAFIHSTRAVEALLRRQGFTRRAYRRTLVWQVALYAR